MRIFVDRYRSRDDDHNEWVIAYLKGELIKRPTTENRYKSYNYDRRGGGGGGELENSVNSFRNRIFQDDPADRCEKFPVIVIIPEYCLPSAISQSNEQTSRIRACLRCPLSLWRATRLKLNLFRPFRLLSPNSLIYIFPRTQ